MFRHYTFVTIIDTFFVQLKIKHTLVFKLKESSNLE